MMQAVAITRSSVLQGANLPLKRIKGIMSVWSQLRVLCRELSSWKKAGFLRKNQQQSSC